MKMKLLVVVAFLMCCLSSARANEDDDTLRFFLSKSPLVISGEITSPVRQIQIKGMTYYSFDFKVREVVKGKLAAAKLVHVRINRTEYYTAEESTFLKEGSSCILFLKPLEIKGLEKSSWQSADLWFGAQPYNYEMLERLKRVSEKESKG